MTEISTYKKKIQFLVIYLSKKSFVWTHSLSKWETSTNTADSRRRSDLNFSRGKKLSFCVKEGNEALGDLIQVASTPKQKKRSSPFYKVSRWLEKISKPIFKMLQSFRWNFVAFSWCRQSSQSSWTIEMNFPSH